MSEIADLFRRLTFGVYVVGVADDERRDAFTAAWVTQTSFEPLLLAVSVNPENASYPILRSGRSFTVNVLRQGQLELARRSGDADFYQLSVVDARLRELRSRHAQELRDAKK